MTPSIEESVDYVLKYNLYFFPKRRTYQYLHRIALATNKTEAAKAYLHAISELTPDNADEHTIPQNLENESLESLDTILKNYEKHIKEKFDEKSFVNRCSDSATACLDEIKKSRAANNEPGVCTLLLCALATGNAELLDFALKESSNPKVYIPDALNSAAYQGATECVKLLLEAGADVDAKNKNGWSPLMWAASNGATECVKVLLAAGADVDAKDNNGDTPLRWAASNGATECVKVLLAAGADVDAKCNTGATPLMKAAFSGKTECAKVLLAAGANVNAKENDGWSPLMTAAFSGKTECAKVLLAAGANVNAKDNDGRSPLMKAAFSGATECAKVLLAAGANVNAKDNDGWSPLMKAAAKGATGCVKVLLAAGADWRLTNKQHMTAKNIACKSEIIQILDKWQQKEEARIDELLQKEKARIYAKLRFWKSSYTIFNYVIAVIFTAWVILSIREKSAIDGSWVDITMYIIGCLIPLYIKTILSVRVLYKPDNINAVIMCVLTDILCAMALCFPAISNHVLSGCSVLLFVSILVQLAIAVCMSMFIEEPPSVRAISIWNIVIAITLFYLGGGVITGSYDFLSNLLVAVRLGY